STETPPAPGGGYESIETSPLAGPFKIDDHRTHLREATRSPGCSSASGRSPVPRRLRSGHTDPPGSAPPSSPDGGSGGPAVPPSSAPAPNPPGGCPRT